MSNALDVLLQLSMESDSLAAFLSHCSNDTWFRCVANVWKNCQCDHKTLEKLSIILQKLSKIK